MLDRHAHPFDQRALDGIGVGHLPGYSAHVPKRIRLSPWVRRSGASTANAEQELDWAKGRQPPETLGQHAPDELQVALPEEPEHAKAGGEQASVQDSQE